MLKPPGSCAQKSSRVAAIDVNELARAKWYARRAPAVVVDEPAPETAPPSSAPPSSVERLVDRDDHTLAMRTDGGPWTCPYNGRFHEKELVDFDRFVAGELDDVAFGVPGLHLVVGVA
jgi:hypothetical protein